MSPTSKRWIIGGLLATGFLAAGYVYLGRESGPTPIVPVVPELSASAQRGAERFAAVCAICHGVNGAGTDQGPPLIHPFYNPGHHNDQSFLSAMSGVRQHHWTFGDMPPQPQISVSDAKSITRFIREVQEANGITFQPHNM